MRKILLEEHRRLRKLYNIEVFRATFLDFLVSNADISLGNPEKFSSYTKNDMVVLNNIGLDEFLNQLKFLKNLGLITSSGNKVILTEKGIDYVERGVFWERMKSLAVEVRTFKVQLITLIVTSIAATASLITLMLKVLDKQ